MRRPLCLRDKLILALVFAMMLVGSLRFHGGGVIPPPPPPLETFGPQAGAQFVIDNAKPLVIADSQKPVGAINVSPGQFTQAFVNSSGAGAKFWCLAGTHNLPTGIQPLTNQQVWAQNGAVFDGNNAGSEFLIAGPAALIQLHGGTYQHQGSASSSINAGALLLSGIQSGGGWVVEDVTVINNYNVGIKIQAPNCTIRRFKTNSCGRYGMSSFGPNDGGQATGALVQSGEIASNNTRNLNTGDDASGTKFLAQTAGTWAEIYCHHNTGFGMWWDGPNQQHTIRDIVSEFNTGSGLFYEIGYGGTVIHHGRYRFNGDGASNNYPFNTQQITVSCAPADGALGTLPGAAIRNEIYNNLVDSGMGTYDSPIVLFNHSDHAIPKNTRNWYVHDNDIWIRGASGTSRTGLADACAAGSLKAGDIGTSPGGPAFCLFDYNHYHVANYDANYLGWEHDTAALMTPGARTWVGFQSRGHEAHGTVAAI